MAQVTLFRFVEVTLDAPGGAAVAFSTDLPGYALAVRGSANVGATNGRHPYRLPLNGTVKGKLYKLSVVPAGVSAVRLYAARVYARVLGPAALPWAWYGVPLPGTSDEWERIQIPVPATPEEWQEAQIPVPPTPAEWSEVRLPVAATPEEWERVALPVKETPVVPEWVQVGVDR